SNDVRASVSLNKSRTVPRCLHDLGTAWAKRSRKVLDGPPDAKRRPASAATERGAYEKSNKSKSHAADSKRPNPAQATERYSATHGRGTAGYIKQAACGFILVNPHGGDPPQPNQSGRASRHPLPRSHRQMGVEYTSSRCAAHGCVSRQCRRDPR